MRLHSPTQRHQNKSEEKRSEARGPKWLSDWEGQTRVGLFSVWWRGEDEDLPPLLYCSRRRCCSPGSPWMILWGLGKFQRIACGKDPAHSVETLGRSSAERASSEQRQCSWYQAADCRSCLSGGAALKPDMDSGSTTARSLDVWDYSHQLIIMPRRTQLSLFSHRGEIPLHHTESKDFFLSIHPLHFFWLLFSSCLKKQHLPSFWVWEAHTLSQ